LPVVRDKGVHCGGPHITEGTTNIPIPKKMFTPLTRKVFFGVTPFGS